jgi:hypothetical protein
MNCLALQQHRWLSWKAFGNRDIKISNGTVRVKDQGSRIKDGRKKCFTLDEKVPPAPTLRFFVEKEGIWPHRNENREKTRQSYYYSFLPHKTGNGRIKISARRPCTVRVHYSKKSGVITISSHSDLSKRKWVGEAPTGPYETLDLGPHLP